ncbi:hypothetical protein DPMN_108019 [Dreissena polymorpha]|uniref:Uncharacterized protein n=1 Tax=Dreissena polymorpha TaxID=45954 RepID=A0A9D4K8A5_DREPO|nr:hypothetical protein DPMN_108019 [Dreissena polymorpha]
MTEQDVHRIHTRRAGSAVQPQRKQLQPDRRSGPNTARVKTREHFKQSCDFCGRKHPKTAKCPAKGVTCHTCGKKQSFRKSVPVEKIALTECRNKQLMLRNRQCM